MLLGFQFLGSYYIGTLPKPTIWRLRLSGFGGVKALSGIRASEVWVFRAFGQNSKSFRKVSIGVSELGFEVSGGNTPGRKENIWKATARASLV